MDNDFAMGYALGSDSNEKNVCVVPSGNNGGWGGNGSWGEMIFAIIILAMFAGGDGFGNGGLFGGRSGGVSGEVQRGFDTSSIINKLDGINSGLCDGFYAMNTGMLNGFNGVDNAICNLGYQNAQLINGVNMNMLQGFNSANVVALQNQNALQTQLSGCCCDLRTGQMQTQNAMERGFCQANYNDATNTTAIIQNAHNDTDRVLAKLDAMEMSRKDETIADLRSKLAACGDQTTAQYIINQLTGVISPRAVPAYPAASPCGLGNWSPNVLTNGWGYNNGCGCNSGCCGCNG